MKLTAFTLTAVAALALATSGTTQPPAAQPPAAQPPADPRAKDAEALPEYPKLAAGNTLAPLNPQKTLYAEVAAGKVLRVALQCEVCMREGALEVFLCRKGTKEHEAILRVDVDAQMIHAALNTAGAKEGTPTQFIDPKTEMAAFKPATGTQMKLTVCYNKGGKTHTHAAQEWVWNSMKKETLKHDWVFAGSQLIPNPCNPGAKPFYGANSGEIVSISNFVYSMLEVPADISKDDANLNYEPKTDKVPPLFSKVWLILEPVPAKK